MVKIFMDLEFTGLFKTNEIISIALVTDSGKEFYAEFTDYVESGLDEWIVTNVISNLKYLKLSRLSRVVGDGLVIKGTDEGVTHVVGTREFVAGKLEKWLIELGELEVWGDCLAYDWVLFCDLFGNPFSVPSNVYYIPFDICTLFKIKGIDPDVSRVGYSGRDSVVHNALEDAYVIKECYERAMR